MLNFLINAHLAPRRTYRKLLGGTHSFFCPYALCSCKKVALFASVASLFIALSTELHFSYVWHLFRLIWW